jgi:hypothetical protein
MTDREKIDIANVLIDNGGGFDELFGKLLLKADIGNSKRLIEAFPDIIEKAQRIIAWNKKNK